MNRISSSTLLLSLLLATVFRTGATAAPGDLDTTFTPPASVNNDVYTTALQPDGKVIVGGWFTDVGGTSTFDRLMRLLPDGSLDPSFTPPADLNNYVTSTALQTDGKVIVGGKFSNVGGTPTLDGLIRLNVDGSLDNGFVPPADLSDSPGSITLQEDGLVIVSGNFMNVEGVATLDRIIRLNPNGSLDPSFTPPESLNDFVDITALQPDGKIIIGGNFLDVGGSPTLDRLVRLDANGALDNTFTPPVSLNGAVLSLLLQEDGKVIVGGVFFNVGGFAARDGLIRLHDDGSLDTAFNPPPLGAAVESLYRQPDGKILVAGTFGDVGGTTTLDRVIRLHPDGSLDTTFTPPASLSDTVASLSFQPDGKIILGGEFLDAGGLPAYDRIIRLEAYTPAAPDPNAALKASLNRKIQKLKKTISKVKKSGQTAKARSLAGLLKKLQRQLRAL